MFGPKISRFILTTCRFHVWLRALASFNYKKYVSVGIFRNLPKLSFGRFFRKTGQCAPAAGAAVRCIKNTDLEGEEAPTASHPSPTWLPAAGPDLAKYTD